MDKQGTLFFKLLTGLFALLFLIWGMHKLLKPEALYELQSAQICEVGDGMTVSGFVVRHESLLYCKESVSLIPAEGQWVDGSRSVAQFSEGLLKVPQSGYLSHTVDGYESCLTPDFVKTASAEDLFSLTPEAPSPQAIGKLIMGQSWYFAAEPRPELSVGQKLSISIGNVECKGTVLRSQELLLIRCSSHLHALTQLRRAEAELVLQKQRGIAVDPKAIYYEKGTSCVYILQAGRVRRKEVQIVGFREDQVLLQEDSLPIGAQVILTNIELTDGMVLK